MKSNKNSRKFYPVFISMMLMLTQQMAFGQSSLNNLAVKTRVVNGATLHYVEKGTGTPVVFVHGSFGDYRTWHYQMQPFAEKYRAIAYSKRYRYPNEPATDSSVHSSRIDAEDLTTFIQALHAGPVHLVGHSAGAYVALVVVIQHPELVKSLVLGEPPIWELTAGDSLGQALMQKAMAETFVPAVKAFRNNQDQKAAKIFLDGVVGKAGFIEALPPPDRKIITDEIPTEKRMFLSEGDPEYRRPFTEADIRDLAVPVLLVSGAHTPVWLAHLTDRLAAVLPNEERVVLPNTSHGLEFTNPEAFNKAVLKFVDKQEKESE